MSWINNIFSSGISKTIDSATKLIDEVYVTEDEKLDKKIILERINENLSLAQVDLNKTEATHSSLFVSGWRPAIGWICALSLFYEFIIIPTLYAFNINIDIMDSSVLHSLVASLLGIGTLRTYEKIKKVAK
jgi:hypothetical protein